METEREPLNALDRCDRCDAQAYVAVQFESTAEVPHPGELLFCGHHTTKHEDKLREFIVHDERAKLNVKLEAAAY